MQCAERAWVPGWPCPVAAILAPSRRGPRDPTYRTDENGAHWRGLRTPEGTVTLRIQPQPGQARVHATAWGPGAAWALDAVPAMLGGEDDPAGFEPRHPVLRALWRRHRHCRVGRSGLVLESLVPAVVEQKVTGQEAYLGFARLVRRFGEPAPGPGGQLGLLVQPSPRVLRAVPSWEWLRMRIDPARSRTLVGVARVAPSLERLEAGGGAESDRRLRSLPGVGVWTSAEVRARALGDPDAVSFGDYHVARDIGWALTGAEVDDAGLAELLAPYRPHRHRVQRLVELGGLGRPRRGPRTAPRTHLPG